MTLIGKTMAQRDLVMAVGRAVVKTKETVPDFNVQTAVINTDKTNGLYLKLNDDHHGAPVAHVTSGQITHVDSPNARFMQHILDDLNAPPPAPATGWQLRATR